MSERETEGERRMMRERQRERGRGKDGERERARIDSGVLCSNFVGEIPKWQFSIVHSSFDV